MKTVMGMASRARVVAVVSIVAGIAACGTLRAQSQLQVIGEPLWDVKNGLCRFMLTSQTMIINHGPADSLSGSLRFSLAMTPNPFPDAGELVAFADIGQLQGGYQMSNFSVPAPVSVPPVTGFRYFTFVLEEFSNTGWITHYGGRSQVSYLREGVSGPWPLWNPAKGKVIEPPDAKPKGKNVVFSQKAGQTGGKIFIVPKNNQYSLSAKLNGSGRTVVYVGSETKGTGGDWSYKSGYAKWKGKTQRVGVPTIDYGVVQGKRSKSVYWLFFQKEGRGFFKNYYAGNESQAVWGSFTLQ